MPIRHLFAAAVITSMTALGASAQTPQTFTATTLDFSGVAGDIEVRVTQTDRIRVQAPAKSPQSLKTRMDGTTLRLDLAENTVTSGNVTQSMGNGRFINKATGPGAVAIQNIPGQSTTRSGGATGPVIVEVPAATVLLATGFVGSAKITGPAKNANVSVDAGEVSFTQLQAGKLAITGGGSVQVAQASGDLELKLPGAGEINVEAGQVNQLVAQLTGSGEIKFGGTAQAARLENRGAGSIHVKRVTAKPSIVNSGAGEVVVERQGG